MSVLSALPPYTAVLTREQFLFYETRTTARLLADGLTEEEAVERIVSENLFQFPTEKTLRRMAQTCLARLKAMEDEQLVHAMATQPSDVAKQICLYAMMRQYRLVWEFMLTVIGAKYRSLDLSFGRKDLNEFFLRLQEQDDTVASWSDATVTKLKQVLQKLLVENEYLDEKGSDPDHEGLYGLRLFCPRQGREGCVCIDGVCWKHQSKCGCASEDFQPL